MKEDYLYHFTSTYHLPSIIKSGFLKLTPSNLIGPRPDDDLHIDPLTGCAVWKTMNYKPVVWLTKDPGANSNANGLNGSLVNKSEIRITITKPINCIPWNVFADRHKMNRSWRKKFEEGKAPENWFVSERKIPFSEIARIENTKTGEVLYLKEQKQEVARLNKQQ